MQRSNTATKPKACEECRQQKIRCDAHLDYSKPCSKCRRSGLECIFTTNFKRRMTRPKGEMQRELDRFKRDQRRAGATDDPKFMAPSVSTVFQSGASQSLPSSSRQCSVDNASASPYLYNPPPVAIPPVPQSKDSAPFFPLLDGLRVERQKLEDCFSLFFKHYHPILPILDPQQGCRACFRYSPLLFWTIIVTGSRRYTLDPTLLEVLAPKVSNLAALAIVRVSEYIPSISALLTLIVWPLPIENASDDPSPVYAGIIMQLSQQNGLHMLGRRQDFLQNHLISDNDREIFLARLWIWCRLVCRSVNVYCGLHPHIFEDAFNLEPHRRGILESLGKSTFWIQRLDCLVANAQDTLMKSKYEHEDVEKPHQLLALLGYYDEEILKIKRQAQDHLAEIWFNSARLHIGSFYFFIYKSPPSKLSRLIEMHHIACAFIDNIAVRDKQTDYALYISEQYYRTLTLAAIVILRICRCPELSSMIDYFHGEQSYFAAIRILKKRVLKNNDLNARMAAMLSQLWQSNRIFRSSDTSVDSLHVRIRSRGGMGVVYDCLWDWRQEFLEQPNPYSKENNNNNPTHDQRPPVANYMADLPTPLTLIEPQPIPISEATTSQLSAFDPSGYASLGVEDDAFFSEWNWSTNTNLFADGQQELVGGIHCL